MTHNPVVRVVLNSGATFATQAMSLASGFLLSVLVARALGVEALGDYSLAMATGGTLVFIADWGVGLWLTREIARRQSMDELLLDRAAGLSLMLGLVVVMTTMLATRALGFSTSVQSAATWAGAYFGLAGLVAVFAAGFVGGERMHLQTIEMAIERGVGLLAGIVGIFVLKSVNAVFAALFVGRLLGLAWAWSLNWREKRLILPRYSYPVWIALLATGTPFAINILMSNLYIQADQLMLGVWSTPADVGLYRAATSLVVPLAIVAASLNQSLFPRMSIAGRNDLGSLRSITDISSRAVFVVGVFFGATIAALAPFLVADVFGPAFASASVLLIVLSPVIGLRFINNTFGSALTASDNQTSRTRLVTLAAILNVAMNVYAIPRFGPMGAAATTVLTELGIFVGCIRALGKKVAYTVAWSKLGAVVLAGLALVIVSRALTPVLGRWIAALVGALVFWLAIWIARVFSAAQRETLRRLLELIVGDNTRVDG